MQKSLSLSSPAPNPALPKFQYKTSLKKPNPIQAKSSLNSINSTSNPYQKNEKNSLIPTMPEIMAASKAQNLNLQLQTLGPFFRVTARSLKTGHELGRAEGLVRVWFGGRILHLDSIRLRRETLGMQRSIFGLGLFVGAVAVRHGFDCGCRKAELLAINDTDLYHSKCSESRVERGDKMQQQVITIFENASFMPGARKQARWPKKNQLLKKIFVSFQQPSEILEVQAKQMTFAIVANGPASHGLNASIHELVRFYTRIGFKAVLEVTGSTMSDMAHMLVWGGRGTRMDADIEELLLKWGRRFKGQI